MEKQGKEMSSQNFWQRDMEKETCEQNSLCVFCQFFGHETKEWEIGM